MMTKERQGQIALLWLKNHMRTTGVRLKRDMKRDFGNEAKELNVPIEEVAELAEILIRELVEEVFPPRVTSHHNPEYTKGM